MKKLLDQVNADIRTNNLEGAIKRVKKFMTFNAILIKERSERKRELDQIDASYDQLLKLSGSDKYERQALLITQIQTLADRIIKRKLWPAIASFLGLVATITGIIAFFWPNIVSGNQDCPPFDKDKCSLIITNFSAENPDEADFIAGQLLLGINENELLKDVVSIARASQNPYNLEGPDAAINCINDCGNDFAIFGSYFPNSLKLSYKIVDEDGASATSDDKFVYQISEDGLEHLQNDMIEASNGASVVVNSICVACNVQKLKPGIYADLADEVTDNLSKQAVFNAAQKNYIKQDKLDKAIKALDNIEEIEDNKYAVFALQKSANLSMRIEKYADAFDRQSRYVQKVEDRLANPQKYRITNQEPSYKTALTKMREKRCLNVYSNIDKMEVTKERKIFMIKTAISDFEIIGPLKYSNEILELKGRLANLGETDSGSVDPIIPEVVEKEHTLKIQVRDTLTNRIIQNAKVLFDNRTIESNANQIFEITGTENFLLGKSISVSAEEFGRQTKTVAAINLTRGLNFKLSKETPWQLEIVPIDAKTGEQISNATAMLRQRSFDIDQTGGFLIEGSSNELLNSTISIFAENYEQKKFVVKRKHLGKRTKTRLAPKQITLPSQEYHVKVRFNLCDQTTSVLRSIKIGDQKLRIQKDLSFNTSTHMKPGSEAKIEIYNGYEFQNPNQGIIVFGTSPQFDVTIPIRIANFNPTRINLSGMALQNAKRMNGAFVTVMHSNVKGIRVKDDGRFSLLVPWRKQCESFKLSAGSERWGRNESELVTPALFYHQENDINVGGVKFNYLGPQID